MVCTPGEAEKTSLDSRLEHLQARLIQLTISRTHEENQVVATGVTQNPHPITIIISLDSEVSQSSVSRIPTAQK